MYIQGKHAFFLALAYTTLLLYLSLTPSDFIPKSIEALDPKRLGLHFFSYTLLAVFWFESLKNYKGAILIAIFVGVLTEILQIFVPDRFADPFDALANISGSFSLAFIKAAQHVLSSSFR